MTTRRGVTNLRASSSKIGIQKAVFFKEKDCGIVVLNWIFWVSPQLVVESPRAGDADPGSL